MTNSLFVGAAIAGMLLGVGCQSGGEPAANGKMAESSKGECWGINTCKATGDCAGKGHSCHAQNECKGRGWKSLGKAECDTRGGEFKQI